VEVSKDEKTILSIVLMSITMFAMIPTYFNAFTQAQSNPTVSLDPASASATQLNEVITVNITISNVQNLWSWFSDITWDPTYLTMVGLPQEGDFLTNVASTVFQPSGQASVKDGFIKGGISDTILQSKGASGSGILATLQFKAIKSCTQTPISLANITLNAPPPSSPPGALNPITPSSTSATSTVSLIIPGPPTADAGKIK